MSFLTPWRLVFLLLPLLLLVGYLLVQRRRHAQVLRFTSVALLDSVAPRRSGWQRHLPAVGVLLAIVAMALAFAQPAWAMRTPKDRATIMLTLDTSASMTATDVSPSRLEAAEAAAVRFVDALPDGIQVGLVTFDSDARLLVAPTNDRAVLTAAIESLEVGGGTATAAGIKESLSAIAAVPKGEDGSPAPAAIVLMSDGAPTVPEGDLSPEEATDAAAAESKAQSVPIDTIAFGTPDGVITIRGEQVQVPYDPATMERIAAASDGHSFAAESADQLASIYDEIGRDVAYVTETRELTAAFAGGALVLAVLAAAGALVWTQKLV